MAIYLRSADKLKFVVIKKWLKLCAGDDKRRPSFSLLPFSFRKCSIRYKIASCPVVVIRSSHTTVCKTGVKKCTISDTNINRLNRFIQSLRRNLRLDTPYNKTIDLFNLYVLFSPKLAAVPGELVPLSFHKLCLDMYVNKT